MYLRRVRTPPIVTAVRIGARPSVPARLAGLRCPRCDLLQPPLKLVRTNWQYLRRNTSDFHLCGGCGVLHYIESWGWLFLVRLAARLMMVIGPFVILTILDRLLSVAVFDSASIGDHGLDGLFMSLFFGGTFIGLVWVLRFDRIAVADRTADNLQLE